MAESQERTVGKTINTWVQTSFIIIVALWGIYTFIYKEWWLPHSAPVNITMNLDLKEVGTGNSLNETLSEPLATCEMKISATNPSTREVYLLPSAWIAYGVKVANVADSKSFLDDANSSLKSKETETGGSEIETPEQGRYTGRHSTVESISTVAVGRLFEDTSLKPGETVTRTLVFYVPRGEYQQIDVRAVMPTARKKGVVDLEWKLDDKDKLTYTGYHLDKNGQRRPIEAGESVKSDPNLELQTSTSRAQLSLRH